MDTAPSDPLDQIWSPEQRAASRDAYRQKGIEAANATIANIPAEQLEAFRPDVWRETVAADWVRAYDVYLDRARKIITAPEATGREDLAKHLILHTQHSPLAAAMILREAGADVSAMPTGGARKERVAAIRRAASAVGGL